MKTYKKHAEIEIFQDGKSHTLLGFGTPPSEWSESGKYVEPRKVGILPNGKNIFDPNNVKTVGKYYVRQYVNGKETGGHFFKRRDQAWKYLSIFEEDNPARACRIYSYAKYFLKKYPQLSNS